MSDDDRKPDGEEQAPRRSLAFKLGLAVLVLPVLGLLYLAFRDPTANVTTRGPVEQSEEDGFERARQVLVRGTDLTTCRDAITQINSQFSQQPSRRPPSLATEQADWLRKHVHLDDGELAEIEGGNYTQLDAHHLDLCFLMRDVARTLAIKRSAAPGTAGPALPPALERAQAAFAWVVRQVRLHERDSEPVPPQFALRRGWGNSLERALVFLSLLPQLGPDDGGQPADLVGCLLFLPDARPNSLRFWACGVKAADGNDLYLFDPRLGLPLPGPAGKGVATLAQARGDAHLFDPLANGSDHHYDVTAEQAKGARAFLACPLSALSPRIHYLQDSLLGATVPVRLAADAKSEHRAFQAAVGGEVGAWKPATAVTRNFLPRDEGGVDEGEQLRLADLRGYTLANDPAVVLLPRQNLAMLELVPWPAMPRQFKDYNLFPYNVGLGRRVREVFAQPFLRSALEPGGPRDLILRGRFGKAAQLLVEENDRWSRQQQRRALAGSDLDQQVNAWVQDAFKAYAEQLRAQNGPPEAAAQAEARVSALWRNAEAIDIVMGNAIAGPRRAEITYLLGLCKHEQAEQEQARQEARGGKPSADSVKKMQVAWGDALGWWKQYADNYPKGSAASAARRLHARALAALGERQQAAVLLHDVAGMTELEKLAALYQARQLEK
jgi:hypothetical protein